MRVTKSWLVKVVSDWLGGWRELSKPITEHHEAKPLETLIIFDIQMENTVIKKTTQNYLSTLIKPHSNFPQSDVGIRRTPLSRSGSISKQSVTSTHANITNVSSFSSSFVACWLPEICLLQGQTARRTHAWNSQTPFLPICNQTRQAFQISHW